MADESKGKGPALSIHWADRLHILNDGTQKELDDQRKLLAYKCFVAIIKIVPPATPGELDYGLISSWIEDCQLHDECSVWSDPGPEGATGIWLVDVQDMCLVQRDWDCRYVALSYVWGDLVAFRSQKTNFPSLQVSGSLNGVIEEIPRVIQDAITFTANIKQRYLWVDSLCIVQDDDIFKERYIPRMHLIYQSSLATIVATTGKDANKGLPGISYPREAPYTPIKFGARSLEAKPPCLLPLMWKSKWKTRAWTFQEGIFSGKSIYFTDYQSEVEEYWISETAGFRRIGDKEHSDHGDQMFASSLHEKQPYTLDSLRLESDVPSNTLMFRGKIIDAKAFEIKSPTFGPACGRYFQGHLTGADEVLQADIDATPSTDLPPEYPSAKEYYEEIFDTTAYNYRRWWALNIMLVERKAQATGI
ncbi:hypothetical protein K4K54_010591 [Colletotrichum sp. SAR 10_86]|nr:hypothetical protein K4K51_008548 [Colletotrichum sp. SAR 10_75]KAI8203788.1 hypothetical protein KHU50_003501 [Colletotrichum sp. SAR 10_65]KAI8233381.1 hypothetical protein K4K54_010591 [Colletotrichum sp. SAR 10_86]